MTKLLSLVAAALVVTACAKRSGPADTAKSAAEIEQEIASFAERGDSAGIARMLQVACRDAATRTPCLESHLVPLANEGRVKLAMGSLGELAALDPQIRMDGHVYAHAIGIAAGKTTSDVGAAFTQCSESFQSGCYHGVIQAWFGKLDAIGAADANGLCEPFRRTEDQRWIRFQCVHGMGHGLTMLYRHDLRKGLEGCDLLSDEWDRDACYGGAFMENIVNVTNPHHPATALAHDEHAGHDMGAAGTAQPFKAVDPADPQYPCSALGEKYQSACYGMQTSVILHNNGGDMEAAAKACDAAPARMRSTCFASLGRDISSYSAQNHAEAVRMCSVGTERYRPWCYLGVVKNVIDINARPLEGIAFCKSVPGDSNKQLCYAAVGEQINILETDVEERRRLCSAGEIAYLSACLYGAHVNRTLPDKLGSVYRSIEGAR